MLTAQLVRALTGWARQSVPCLGSRFNPRLVCYSINPDVVGDAGGFATPSPLCVLEPSEGAAGSDKGAGEGSDGYKEQAL